MTGVIQFKLKELTNLIEDKNSCVIKETITQNITFQPWCLSNIKDSIVKIMNYKIGKFDKQLNGIILSYKNVKILEDVYAIRNDSSELSSDIQADFYVFQPHVGATLRGVINKKGVTHLSLLVHKVFNVVIPNPNVIPGSSWVGSQLVLGQEVLFTIVVLDLYGALPYIRGSLDEENLPKMLEEAENIRSLTKNNNESTAYDTSSKVIKSVGKHKHDKDASPNKNNVDSVDKGGTSIKKKTKKYNTCSDSDIVSDVDESVLKEQESLVKKVMAHDKKKRGLEISFCKDYPQSISPLNKSSNKSIDQSISFNISELTYPKMKSIKDESVNIKKIKKSLFSTSTPILVKKKMNYTGNSSIPKLNGDNQYDAQEIKNKLNFSNDLQENNTEFSESSSRIYEGEDNSKIKKKKSKKPDKSHDQESSHYEESDSLDVENTVKEKKRKPSLVNISKSPKKLSPEEFTKQILSRISKESFYKKKSVDETNSPSCSGVVSPKADNRKRKRSKSTTNTSEQIEDDLEISNQSPHRKKKKKHE